MEPLPGLRLPPGSVSAELVPGDAFRTLQTHINVEERRKQAHAKPFPQKAISYLWAVVISSHVDSIFYSFLNLSL